MYAWGKKRKLLVFTAVYVCVKAKLTLVRFFFKKKFWHLSLRLNLLSFLILIAMELKAYQSVTQVVCEFPAAVLPQNYSDSDLSSFAKKCHLLSALIASFCTIHYIYSDVVCYSNGLRQRTSCGRHNYSAAGLSVCGKMYFADKICRLVQYLSGTFENLSTGHVGHYHYKR